MTIAETWMTYDSYNASKWINTLESGSHKDSAIVAVVNGMMNSDPASAYEWAHSISDPKLRTRVISTIPKQNR